MTIATIYPARSCLWVVVVMPVLIKSLLLRMLVLSSPSVQIDARSPDLNTQKDYLLTSKPQSLASVLGGITAKAPICATVTERLAVSLPPGKSSNLCSGNKTASGISSTRPFQSTLLVGSDRDVWNKLLARAAQRSVVDYYRSAKHADLTMMTLAKTWSQLHLGVFLNKDIFRTHPSATHCL
jgi:hypothetical protein